MRRLLREPLLHFLLLGAVLFGASASLDRRRGGDAPAHQIVLTLDDLRQLDVYFESQWRRPPTPEELERLVESRIQEEILYREALAMGLDKDDTIVKRRMGQKMRFLAEDVATAHEPSRDELKSWYTRNSEKFALPPRLSFRHLFFSPDRRGEHAAEDAAKALAKLAGQRSDSKLGASLADPFMLQDSYGDRTPEQLAQDFGPPFAQALAGVKPGSWQGPIESGYGWHLVFVDSVIPGRVPALEEIEGDVKTAWLADQKEESWRKTYAAMRAKYSVLLPAPPEMEGAPAPASLGAKP
jgi:hypothetical protein